jgi:hypothetical protein
MPGTLNAMNTRAIVTSTPHVACYVCERTLLRGEHPETFIVDGSPQTVCELCAPRAAHHGWPRAEEGQLVAEPLIASRRGSGLFGRLRGAARPTGRRPTPSRRTASGDEHARALAASAAPGGDAAAIVQIEDGAPDPTPVEWALAVYNSSEYPRRNASLARSLGVPDVSVAFDEDLGLVTIVVAWELCWYRYRVDLDEQPAQARMIAEGRTLDELDRGDRLGNALADEQGAVSPIAARV